MNGLSRLRKAKTLTQEQFSQKIGVSRQALVTYETGRCKVPPKVAARIRDYFGLSTEEMWNVLYASCDNEAS